MLFFLWNEKGGITFFIILMILIVAGPPPFFKKLNYMKTLTKLTLLLLLAVSCTKPPLPKDNIQGIWKVYFSHDDRDTFYTDDVQAIQITDEYIKDCNFFSQHGSFLPYEYTYENMELDVRNGSFVFDKVERVDYFFLQFTYGTGGEYVIMFGPVPPNELDSLINQGCFK